MCTSQLNPVTAESYDWEADRSKVYAFVYAGGTSTTDGGILTPESSNTLTSGGELASYTCFTSPGTREPLFKAALALDCAKVSDPLSAPSDKGGIDDVPPKLDPPGCVKGPFRVSVPRSTTGPLVANPDDLDNAPIGV